MSESDGPEHAVLIADDDSLVRMVLRMAVENLGHDAVDVATSDEIVTALSARSFGLCIMDASIPGTTLEHRLGLLETLAPTMPVIIMSGYTDQPEAVRAHGLRFMGKPISLDELTTALAETGLHARVGTGPA